MITPVRPRSLPIVGLLVVVTAALLMSISSISQQFAGASERIARPAASIPTRCDGDVRRVHVLLDNTGSAPARFEVLSRVGSGPAVDSSYEVAAGDTHFLSFAVPSGADGTFRVTSADDAMLDRRSRLLGDCV